MYETKCNTRVVAMLAAIHISLIALSCYAVQLPFELYGIHLTWGAFTYPFVFVVTDLTVRLCGRETATKVIRWSVLPGLVLSYVISSLFHDGAYTHFHSLTEFNGVAMRVMVAGMIAYAVAQLLDIVVFNRLRQMKQWYAAPLASSVFGSVVDTYLFFGVAFASSDTYMAEHWVSIATSDLGVKFVFAICMLLPTYGILLHSITSKFKK